MTKQSKKKLDLIRTAEEAMKRSLKEAIKPTLIEKPVINLNYDLPKKKDKDVLSDLPDFETTLTLFATTPVKPIGKKHKKIQQ